MKLTILMAGTSAYNDAGWLSAELEPVLDAHIATSEAGLDEAPADGFIVTFGRGMSTIHQVAARTVCLGVGRGDVPHLLEDQQLCAAFDAYIYFTWRWQRGRDRAYGMFGRRDVAKRIGARFGKAAGYPRETEHYGMLASDDPDLPTLIARYLVAYAELFPSTQQAQSSRGR